MSKKRRIHEIGNECPTLDRDNASDSGNTNCGGDNASEESGMVEHHMLRLLQHQHQQTHNSNNNKNQPFGPATILNILCSDSQGENKQHHRQDYTHLKDTYIFFTNHLIRRFKILKERKENDINIFSSWITEKDIADTAIPHLIRAIMANSQQSSGAKIKSKTNKSKKHSSSSKEIITSSTISEKESCTHLQWKFLAICFEVLLLENVTSDKCNDNDEKKNSHILSSRDGVMMDAHEIMRNQIKTIDDANNDSPSNTVANKRRKVNQVEKNNGRSSSFVSALTKGMWNKFLLEAMTAVFSSNKAQDYDGDDDDGNNVSIWPARCYTLLMMFGDMIQPSMDYLCNTLLVELTKFVWGQKNQVEQSSSSSPANVLCQAQVTVLQVTIFVLWHHHLNGKGGRVSNAANPKKSFLWLSSPTSLTCFSRLRYLMIDEPVDGIDAKYGSSSKGRLASFSNTEQITDSGSTIIEVIVNILRQGLFHPQHHLDGFCTMNLKMPDISYIQSYLHETFNSNITDESVATTNGTSSKGQQAKSNSCYQQELFQTLNSILSIDENDKDTTTQSSIISSDDDSYIAMLLPSIIEDLMEATQDHPKLSTSKIARVQFRFWSFATYPMIQQLFHQLKSSITKNVPSQKAISTSMIVQSLEKCVLVLTKYESYLPSHDDPDDLHLEYLKTLGEMALRFVETIVGSQNEEADHNQLLNCIAIMKNLFSLNHHIYHESLDRLLMITSHVFRSQPLYQHPLKGEVISHLCVTYQKLRQLPHLLDVILKCVSINPVMNEQKNSSIRDIDNIVKSISLITVHHDPFVKSLSTAIKSLPSGQISDLWNIFLSYIKSTCTSGQSDQLCFVIEMFVLFIKAIPVNEFNAMEIASLCQNSMESSVSDLIQYERHIESMQFNMEKTETSCGLYLCGWIVDLHTKCCFWLNDIVPQKSLLNHGKDGNENKIISALLETINRVMGASDSGDNSTFSESDMRMKTKLQDKKEHLGILQHLCCHRIQQLHSMIYHHEEIEGLSEMDSEDTIMQESTSSILVREAHSLVEFVIYAALNRNVCGQHKQTNGVRDTFISIQNNSSEWGFLAKMLSMWTKYSQTDQIIAFLRWVFFTLGMEDKSQAGGMEQMPTSKSACWKKYISFSQLSQEKKVVSALLHDATFLEEEKVAEQYVAVGLSCAVELIQMSGSSKSQWLKTPFDDSWSPLSDELCEILQEETPTKFPDEDFIIHTESVQSATKIIDTLNQIHTQIIGRDDLLPLLDTSIRIHATLNYFSKLCKGSAASKTILVCRETISQTLSHLSQANISFTSKDSPVIKYFMLHMIQSSFNLIEKIPNCEGELATQDEIISSAGRVLGNLLSYCLCGFEGSAIHCFVSTLKTFIQNESGNITAQHHMSMMLRPILLKMIRFSQKKQDDVSYSSLFTEAGVLELIDIMNKQMIGMINEEVAQCVDQDNLHNSLLLFMIDYLRLQRIFDQGCDTNLATMVQDGSVLKSLATLLKNKIQESKVGKVDSLLYFMCLMSTQSLAGDIISETEISEQLQMIFLQRYVTTNGNVEVFLESAYSELIQNASEEQLNTLIKGLMDIPENIVSYESKSAMISARIYCFHIILLTIDKEQFEKMTDVIRAFVGGAIGLHCPRPTNSSETSAWTTNILIAQSFLCAIVGRKDIILLEGNDIARILGAISAIIPTTNQLKEMDLRHIPQKSWKLNISCSALLSASLRNYNRQLYGCAPPFTAVFRLLFKYIMCPKEIILENESERLRLLRDFTSLCQSLVKHKDVFKKHVVTLILDYTTMLKKGTLNSTTRDEVMPAIYSLLDTLSEHEIKQLNCLMDTTSKALFQTTFQQYKKRKYTGNF